VVIVLGATLLSGLVPALVSARANSAEMMKEGGRGNSSRFVNALTRTLVVGQIALTAALLIAAILQIKSIRNQIQLDYGYDENGVYSARMGLFEGDYPTSEARQQFFARALRAFRANSAFESAALTGRFRMTFGGFGQYEVDGHHYVTDRDRPQGNFEFVSDGYFSTIGLKILEGRDFTIDDNDSRQAVAIVSTGFARKYYGAESPLGKRIRIFNPAQQQPWRTIVGVVPRTRNEAPGELNVEALHLVQEYLLASQDPQPENQLHVRTSLRDITPIVAAVKREVESLDPNQPIGRITTMDDAIASSLATRRLMMVLLGAFAVLALVLASVGLYGVMALTVTQRTRELGIRMALGAERTNIFKLVLSQGMTLIAIGIGIGLIGAIAAGRALMSLLYNVGAIDAGAVITAVASLVLVALIACCVPARRATRVDPIVALRYE